MYLFDSYERYIHVYITIFNRKNFTEKLNIASIADALILSIRCKQRIITITGFINKRFKSTEGT